MTVNVTKNGPGTLTLGTTPGTEFGCQFLKVGVNPEADEEDSLTTLCGESVAGGVTLSYKLAGTVLQDLAVASGLVEYSWEHKLETVDFTFTPNTVAEASMTGKVVVLPIAFGDSANDAGTNMQAEIEWTISGEPTPTWFSAS